MGKMQLYLIALDRDVKKPYENPRVGIGDYPRMSSAISSTTFRYTVP